MSERHLIVDHLKFSYEGLFNATEIYNLIVSFFYEKGWDYHEKMNQELITPSGKQITLILLPWKSSSDYYKLQIKLKVHLIDIKDVEVEHQGQNLKINQGLLRMTIDGYVLSDRNNAWSFDPKEKKSVWYWLFSLLMEKYFFHNHFRKFETWVKSDIDDLLIKLKSYLNTYKYSYHS